MIKSCPIVRIIFLSMSLQVGSSFPGLCAHLLVFVLLQIHVCSEGGDCGIGTFRGKMAFER